MPIHAPFWGFLGHIPPNNVTHRPNPKKEWFSSRMVLLKDHPWAKPRHLSHKTQKSVARFELGVGARKQGQDRTGQEKSHKRVIFHLFVEKPSLKRYT